MVCRLPWKAQLPWPCMCRKKGRLPPYMGVVRFPDLSTKVTIQGIETYSIWRCSSRKKSILWDQTGLKHPWKCCTNGNCHLVPPGAAEFCWEQVPKTASGEQSETHPLGPRLSAPRSPHLPRCPCVRHSDGRANRFWNSEVKSSWWCKSEREWFCL